MMEALRQLIHMLAKGTPSADVDIRPDISGSFIEALRSDYPATSSYKVAHTPFTWHDAAVLIATHRLFWMSVPIAALDPNEMDIRPHALSMAATLINSPTEVDVRAIHTILKRMRRYVIFGRPRYTVSPKDFTHLLHSQAGRCNHCGHTFSAAELSAREFLEEPDALAQIGDLRPPQIDHIIPIFLAGHSLKNCQVLCITCNASKGAALFWPLKSAILGPQKPSDLLRTSKTNRWMILVRDKKCTICLRHPTTLEEGNELDIWRADPSLGWTIENSRSACRQCAERIGLSANVPFNTVRAS